MPNFFSYFCRHYSKSPACGLEATNEVSGEKGTLRLCTLIKDLKLQVISLDRVWWYPVSEPLHQSDFVTNNRLLSHVVEHAFGFAFGLCSDPVVNLKFALRQKAIVSCFSCCTGKKIQYKLRFPTAISALGLTVKLYYGRKRKAKAVTFI